MARFNITTKTKDDTKNSTTEILSVKAGPGTGVPPEVSFSFPQYVSVQGGGVDYPAWPSGIFRGFAFCGVTPSPNNGDGAFLTQCYYNSGNYPNNPNRRFSQTFSGVGSTLSAQWNLSQISMSVNGGGEPVVGFASQNDLSGVRRALILTQDNQAISQQPGDDGIPRIPPDRLGGRVPLSDDMIMVYTHDISGGLLKTIQNIQISGGRTSWPANTIIYPHPYHYTPIYENNGAITYSVMPYIAVLEHGSQYPLKGLVSVSGSQVSGIYSRFTSEVSGLSAIRFNGEGEWYLISGVVSDTIINIWNYGDVLKYTGALAEVCKVTLGSGIVSVLPDLAGCNLWYVTLNPKYKDNDAIPGSSVTYNAVIGGTGSPSGTLKYDWQVQTEISGVISTSGTSNAGPSLTVPYTLGIRKNVIVQVSGIGQPACVHSDQTGLIKLQPGADVGIWTAQLIPTANLNSNGVLQNLISTNVWNRTTSTSGNNYFHHWVTKYESPWVSLPDTSISVSPSIQVPKGSLNDWPSRGTVVLHEPNASRPTHTHAGNIGLRVHTGTYTGKNQGANYDELTGIVWKYHTDLDETNQPDTPSTCTLASVSTAGKWIGLQSTQHMPMTYITGKSADGKTLKVEDVRRLAQARYGNKQNKLWLFCPGMSAFSAPMVLTVTSYNLSTNEITIAENTLYHTQYGSPGDQLVLAPWYHWRNGASPNLESVSTNYWNAFNQSLFQFTGLWKDPLHTFYNLGTYTFNKNDTIYIALTDFMTGVVDGMYKNGFTAGANPHLFQYMWLPIAYGRIIIPDVTRGNLVLEFDSRTSTPTTGNDASVTLNTCKVVVSETTLQPDSNGNYTIKGNGAAFAYTKLRPTGVYDNYTTPGNDPAFGIDGAGQRKMVIQINNIIVDVIQGNLDPNNNVGTLVTPLAKPIWESVLSSFPNGGIPQVGNMYRSLDAAPTPDTGGSGGGGGCIRYNQTVYLKNNIDDEEGIPSQMWEAVEGKYILGIAGYQKILWSKAYVHSSYLVVKFENDTELELTSEHPVATGSAGDDILYTLATDLMPGMEVLTITGLVKIKSIYEVTCIPQNFYDINVENTPCYYASDVLVHNMKKQNPDAVTQ